MKSTTKLNNIQVLRAFAAVAVVVYHTGFAFPFLHPFGSFGVDVFFVISGYIMARILDPGSDSSSDFFFRRRVLRIVPPYWFFTILLYFIALRVPQLMGATRANIGDLLMSLLFIPFTKGSGLIRPLLFIGWSLNYEMFFYLALAVGLLIYERFRFRIGPAFTGAILVVLTMFACIPFADANTPAKFYSEEIVLEFILGIFSYYLCRSVSDPTARRLRWPALVVCFASALLLIAVQGYFTVNIVEAAHSRTLTLGVLAFLLVSTASLLSQAGWDTRLAWLVLIGDASYILYLIHPYCEYSLDRILGARYPWLRSVTASGALAGVSLSILAAVLIHLYCERPTVRFLNRKFGGRRKSTEFANPS